MIIKRARPRLRVSEDDGVPCSSSLNGEGEERPYADRSMSVAPLTVPLSGLANPGLENTEGFGDGIALGTGDGTEGEGEGVGVGEGEGCAVGDGVGVGEGEGEG